MRSTQILAVDGVPLEAHVSSGSDEAVVVVHGGHMSAAIDLGEQGLRDRGYTVITPSRPGYGATPIDAGSGTRSGFADLLAQLPEHVGCSSVAAVIGISAGGPTAIDLAARHPHLVRRLVLQNSVSTLPWPDARTRRVGRIVFAPQVERWTWAATRLGLRVAPGATLRGLMSALTTRPAREVVEELTSAERRTLVDVFAAMRSGTGFRCDLESATTPESLRCVSQPTLVMTSADDASVGPEHGDDLVEHLAHATRWIGGGSSHLLWFGPGSGEVAAALADFIER